MSPSTISFSCAHGLKPNELWWFRVPPLRNATAFHFQKHSKISSRASTGVDFSSSASSPSLGNTAVIPSSSVAPKDVRETFSLLKETFFKEIHSLESVQGLLFWDQQVMMPPQAAEARGAQLSALAKCIHAKHTSKELGRCLEELQREIAKYSAEWAQEEEKEGWKGAPKAKLTRFEVAAVREALREYERASKIPESLAAASAAHGSRAHVDWTAAKKKSAEEGGGAGFALFADSLSLWLDITREMARVVSPELRPYDYCLDKFERGMTNERLTPVFDSLKHPLIQLLRDIQDQGSIPDDSFLQSKDLFSGQFSLETQRRLSRRIAEEIGFSFARGRLDESAHPFTMGVASPFDVRLTSRFNESDLSSGLLATVHEVGHGMYEQGRNAALASNGLPSSRPPSMGMHESQSLLWERHVAKSKDFWQCYWPVMLRSFSSLPRNSGDSPHQFYRLINAVKPSLIRVEADEVTYPLHILLRLETERDLVEGNLEVKDLPFVWDNKMQEYFGIRPQNDSVGCLQDVHWSAGLFGYFPTYSIGAMYAAQLFATAEVELNGLRSSMIAKGEFGPLKQWLSEKVYLRGSLYETADELVTEITGEGLNPQYFLKYLKEKYGELYNLQ